MDDTINTSSTITHQTWQYCPHRLQCGVCRLTNSICPVGGVNINWQPAWTCCVNGDGDH